VIRLAEIWDESAAHVGVRLDAPALVTAHTAPGQFVLLGDPAHAGEGLPLALASVPGHAPELLVKRDSPAGAILASLAPGTEVDVSLPAGRGFPLAEHAGKDLLLCAAGSGIAALRAVITLVARERSRWGRVWLFYGQRTAAELAYRREHDAWRAADIAVTCVVSGDDPAWPGVRGHVHQALAHAAPRLDGAVAYVVGMPGMIAQVTVQAEHLGLPLGAVYLNF
jgi:NAD(P)H-flavin reductase